jgi:hypothetical protein
MSILVIEDEILSAARRFLRRGVRRSPGIVRDRSKKQKQAPLPLNLFALRVIYLKNGQPTLK